MSGNLRSRLAQEKRYGKLRHGAGDVRWRTCTSTMPASNSWWNSFTTLNRAASSGYEGKLLSAWRPIPRSSARISWNEYRGQRARPASGCEADFEAHRAKGWKTLLDLAMAATQSRKSDTGISEISAGIGPPRWSEFRRIVATVQKGEREASKAKKEMIEANLQARDLYCQEIYEPRPAVPGPDPGRAISV